MSWQFKITPHPHKRIVHGVPVQIIKDVQVLRVLQPDGRWLQVGYCGAEPGRPLTIFGDEPPEFIEAARKFVTEQVGEPAAVVRAEGLQGKEEKDDE